MSLQLSRIEHRSPKAGVAGSIPVRDTDEKGRLLQSFVAAYFLCFKLQNFLCQASTAHTVRVTHFKVVSRLQIVTGIFCNSKHKQPCQQKSVTTFFIQFQTYEEYHIILSKRDAYQEKSIWHPSFYSDVCVVINL